MRAFLPLVALVGSTALSSAAFASSDGSFNVNYNDIGFDLVQIGDHGELVVKANGFGGMSYGTCTVNFTRDEAGNPKDYAPVVQGSSAECPEKIAFSIAPKADGMYALKFTEGGSLTSQDFDLFPVLLPMQDSFKVTAPKGFDIMGMTIGQTRAEIEALLTEKGFTRDERNSDKAEYNGGYSKAFDIWGRGVSEQYADRVADTIAVTYTPLFEGQEASEKVEYLVRQWHINPSENLSKANLDKSLWDKHGKPNHTLQTLVYAHDGTFMPDAFQPECREDIHLQHVRSGYQMPGESGEIDVSAACGASINIMTLEDYNAPGRANLLKLELRKGDTAYEAFWPIWTAREEKALKERYDLQANMTGAAPEL